MIIKNIDYIEVDSWLKQQNLVDTWHTDFFEWKKHLLLASKKWPWIKKFYKGKDNWLGIFDNDLKAIYWYTIVDNEMYDGFLISDKKTPGAGIKLARALTDVTTSQWTKNWSMCSDKYLKFNQRLGYVEQDKVKLNNGYEVWLLCRQKF